MKEVKKWGFGAAPFKRDTELRNRKALVLLRRFLQNEADNYENLPDGISCVKGLFSRIIRQDQWDWFTTSLYFDYIRQYIRNNRATQTSRLMMSFGIPITYEDSSNGRQ